MPYPKDWRRYEPIMQVIVKAWLKGHGAPMEATYETINRAHTFRLRFYAFIRALEKAAGKDKDAKELWDAARQMTFRISKPNGERVDFMKGYTGPAKLLICQAGFDKFGDAFSEFAQQNGLMATMEELADTSRPSFQAILKAQEERDKLTGRVAETLTEPAPINSETVDLAPPTQLVEEPGIPPFAQMSLKRQPSWAKFAIEEPVVDRAEADSPPAPEWQPDPAVEYWKDSHFTKEEIMNAGAQVFWARILDAIWAKSPESAINIAQKQLVAYSPDGSSTHSKEANVKILAETHDWLAGKNLAE